MLNYNLKCFWIILFHVGMILSLLTISPFTLCSKLNLNLQIEYMFSSNLLRFGNSQVQIQKGHSIKSIIKFYFILLTIFSQFNTVSRTSIAHIVNVLPVSTMLSKASLSLTCFFSSRDNNA